MGITNLNTYEFLRLAAETKKKDNVTRKSKTTRKEKLKKALVNIVLSDAALLVVVVVVVVVVAVVYKILVPNTELYEWIERSNADFNCYHGLFLI